MNQQQENVFWRKSASKKLSRHFLAPQFSPVVLTLNVRREGGKEIKIGARVLFFARNMIADSSSKKERFKKDPRQTKIFL